MRLLANDVESTKSDASRQIRSAFVRDARKPAWTASSMWPEGGQQKLGMRVQLQTESATSIGDWRSYLLSLRQWRRHHLTRQYCRRQRASPQRLQRHRSPLQYHLRQQPSRQLHLVRSSTHLSFPHLDQHQKILPVFGIFSTKRCHA